MAQHQAQALGGAMSPASRRRRRRRQRQSWTRCLARAVIAVGIATSGAVVAGRASADSLQITYEAPPECPGAEAFAGAVRAQTKRASISTGGDGGPGISVRIDRDGRQLRGRLAIRGPLGEPSVREVTAATCDGVVSALALMTALAIDADLEARPTNPSAAGSEEKPPAPEIPSPTPKRKKPTPEPTKPETPKPRLPDTAAPRPASSPSHPRWQLGSHAGAFGALAPSLAWGAVSFLDRSTWGTTGAAWSLRLGLALAESPPVGLAEGTATFRWIVGRFSACPLAVAAGPLTARPCVGIDAGSLRGLGSALPRPLQETRGWIAGTVHGRLQLHLGEGVYLETEGGFTLPFIRDRFVFLKPARDIHAVPPLSGFTTAGLGVVLQ
jgi:hypothetical protein